MGNTDAHIYIIEDDPAVRSALRMLAVSYGWHADDFSSAEDFLARAPHPDEGCLVMDLTMPGMNGVELQQELYRRGVRLPTVVLTARPELLLARQARLMGATSVLPKPFHEEDFRCSVENALQT